ncbi:MAG: acyl carrier protein [Pirellulales bacterium]
MTAEDIKLFIIESLQDHLQNAGVDPKSLTDDFDLLDSGLIDSMNFLHLVVSIEDRLGIDLNFEDLSPEEMTKIGSLCHHVQLQINDE